MNEESVVIIDDSSNDSTNFETVEAIAPNTVRTIYCVEELPDSKTTSGIRLVESYCSDSEIVGMDFVDLTHSSSDDDCEVAPRSHAVKEDENINAVSKRHNFYSMIKVRDTESINRESLLRAYLQISPKSTVSPDRESVEENKEVVEMDGIDTVGSPTSSKSVETACLSLDRSPRPYASLSADVEKALLAEFRQLKNSLNLELAENDIWQHVRLPQDAADADEEGGHRLTCSMMEMTPEARGAELLLSPMPKYRTISSPERRRQLFEVGPNTLKRAQGIQQLRRFYHTLSSYKKAHGDELSETEGCPVVKKLKFDEMSQIDYVKSDDDEDQRGETTDPIQIEESVIREECVATSSLDGATID